MKDGAYETMSVDSDIVNTFEKVKASKKYGMDHVTLVTGLPGKGKSQFAIGTWAPLITKPGNKIYVEFTTRDFINRCANPDTNDEDTVVCDEAHEGMNSGNVAKAEFQEMMNMLMLIRQKKLNIIIVTQDFFSLAKTIALLRSNTLFHCISDKKGKQGLVLCFGRKKKKMLFILGKQYINYGAVKANYTACFRRNEPNMPEDYIERKRNHLIEQNKELKDTGNVKRKDVASKIMDHTILNLTKLQHSQSSIAKIMGIGHTTVKEHWAKMKKRSIVPEEYINRHSFRNKSPITPTNRVDVPSKDVKSGAHSIVYTPNNTHNDTQQGEGEEINDES